MTSDKQSQDAGDQSKIVAPGATSTPTKSGVSPPHEPPGHPPETPTPAVLPSPAATAETASKPPELDAGHTSDPPPSAKPSTATPPPPDAFGELNEQLMHTLEPLTARSLADDAAIHLAEVQRGFLEVTLDAQRFSWEKTVARWELVQKCVVGLLTALAAILVAWWGKGLFQELKPVHLATGAVSTMRPRGATFEGGIDSNVVKSGRLNLDAPVDAGGHACRLAAGAKALSDRPDDVREPYYLTSDFELDPSRAGEMAAKYGGDDRCFRREIIHVKAHFSRTPTVTTQISSLDAESWDTTDNTTPILRPQLADGGGPLIPRSLNLRIETRVQSVNDDGFDIVVRTWNDSRIYRAEVTYAAFIQ